MYNIIIIIDLYFLNPRSFQHFLLIFRFILNPTPQVLNKANVQSGQFLVQQVQSQNVHRHEASILDGLINVFPLVALDEVGQKLGPEVPRAVRRDAQALDPVDRPGADDDQVSGELDSVKNPEAPGDAVDLVRPPQRF